MTDDDIQEITLCPDCRAEGGHWVNGRSEPCATCDGTGRAESSTTPIGVGDLSLHEAMRDGDRAAADAGVLDVGGPRSGPGRRRRRVVSLNGRESR